ncbi:vacuolar assembly protein DID2 [Syncephalis plumigaleata]|nr:vacuolar assembly protein DID2 [Syncephalis plumigaleata]
MFLLLFSWLPLLSRGPIAHLLPLAFTHIVVVFIMESILYLKFTTKTLQRQSKRCQKEEEAEKRKVKKAIQQGNMDGAPLNLLKLSSRVDAVTSRVQTAVTMRQVSTSMAGVVKGMDKALETMNLEKISMIMDKFEDQFEDIDVQTQYMEGAMVGSTAQTTPQGEVDTLLQQVADEAGLELKHELGEAVIPATHLEEEKEKERADELTERLARLRQV